MKLDNISVQNKYRIIGIILIVAIILIYNFYNDNLEKEYQNNLNDYPDSKQIEKDIQERLEDNFELVKLNNKSLNTIIDFDKDKFSNFEYEKTSEDELVVTMDYTYEEDFIYQTVIEAYYKFEDNKYVYDYMYDLGNEGRSEISIANCDKAYKNTHGQTHKDIIDEVYRSNYDTINYDGATRNEKGECVYSYDAYTTNVVGDKIKDQIQVKFYLTYSYSDEYYYGSSYNVNYNVD